MTRKLMNCTPHIVRLEAPNGKVIIPTYHGVEFQEGERPGYATFGGIHIPIIDIPVPIGLPEPERGVIFILPYWDFTSSYDRKDITGVIEGKLYRKFPVWETGAGARVYSKPRRRG